MDELSIEEIAAALAAGEKDVADVSVTVAPEVAEALAEEGAAEALGGLVERVFPRLVKKERVDEIEAIWLACCAADVLPLAVMSRTAERLIARGHGDRSSEMISMLAETLFESGRPDEALKLLIEALRWESSPLLLERGGEILGSMFPEASNREQVLRELGAFRGDGGSEVLCRAERALRFAPGSFIQWIDFTVAQVVSTDGVTAKMRHPSGAVESMSVDIEPPPRVVSAKAHEVLRLFEPEELRESWKTSPTKALMSLLKEQGGFINVPGLRGILVPRVLDEPAFEQALAALKLDCGLGHDDHPTYDSRRRMFIAPGHEAPKPRRRVKPIKKVTEERPESTSAVKRSADKTSAIRPLTTERPVWLDLTLKPEIRSLISGVEQEIDTLTRELNVDLPVRLEEARAHGDLRENAEYDAAKERLRFVQARVDQLRSWVAQLRELSRVRLVRGKVSAMSVVRVTDAQSGEEREMRLVPAELPEPRAGDVSVGTPYGRALLGHAVGDVVVVRLPRREERLEIIEVTDPDGDVVTS